MVTEHSSGIVSLGSGSTSVRRGACSLPYVVEALLRPTNNVWLSFVRKLIERLTTGCRTHVPVSVLRAAVVEVVGEPLPSERRSGATAQDGVAAVGSVVGVVVGVVGVGLGPGLA